MQFSPVWSAARAMFKGSWGPICWVLLGALRLSPLLVFFIPVKDQVLDIVVFFLVAGALGAALLSTLFADPLKGNSFLLFLRLSLWLKAVVALCLVKMVLVRLLWGQSISETSLVRRIGESITGDSTHLSLLLFLLLLLLQRKVRFLCWLLIWSSARFDLEVYPSRSMVLDAKLFSKEISREQGELERSYLQRQQDTQQDVARVADWLRRDATAVDSLVVCSLVLTVAASAFHGNPGPESWLHLVPSALGGIIVLSGLGLAWAFLLGVWAKESAMVELEHTDSEDSFPNKREMLLALGGLGFETVTLAGLGMPPGTSLALQVLVKKKYRLDRTPVAVPSPISTPAPPPIPAHEITVFLGRDLLSLVDPTRGNTLGEMVSQLRCQFLDEFGFIFEAVRFRDDRRLNPFEYQIHLGEQVVGGWELKQDKLLALGPVEELEKWSGQLTTEPVYNLPARWVDRKRGGGKSGCVFFGPREIIGSHLLESLRAHAGVLLTPRVLGELLSLWEKLYPHQVNRARKERARFIHIMQELVREQVSLAPMPQILECFFNLHRHYAGEFALVNEMRVALAQDICSQYCSDQGRLHVLVADPRVVTMLRNGMSVGEVKSLRHGLEFRFETLLEGGMRPVLLTERDVRRSLRDIAIEVNPQACVLCWDEIYPGIDVKVLGTVEV